MIESDIFITLFSELGTALDTFIIHTSTSVIAGISPIFTSMIIIWLAIWGYMTMFGKTQEPMTDGFMRILRISFIIAMALTVGTYNGVVVAFMSHAPAELANMVSGGAGINPGSSLDSLFNKIFTMSNTAYQQAGLFDGNFGLYFIAAAVIIIGSILLITGAFMFMLSQTYTAILLAIGPIFIIMLLFDNTKRYFESWLGYLVNYGLILILVSAVLELVIQIADYSVSKAPTGDVSFGSAVIICVVLGINIKILKEVPTLASALGGGFAMATNTGIGNAMNRMRPTNVRRSMRQVRQDTRIAGRALTAPGRAAKRAFS